MGKAIIKLLNLIRKLLEWDHARQEAAAEKARQVKHDRAVQCAAEKEAVILDRNERIGSINRDAKVKVANLEHEYVKQANKCRAKEAECNHAAKVEAKILDALKEV